MRIGILTTQCPFVTGGAELHARALEHALRREGHEAEIISMPFKWYPSRGILDHMVAARALDVSNFNGEAIDIAICLKFPAYLMRHPNKRYWLLHQHRQAYDLWASGTSDLFDDQDGRLVRDAIKAADDTELRSGGPIFANSANVARRLKIFNGLDSEPLYHPPPLADRLKRGDDEGYLLYPSRIAPAKRQELVIRALARTASVKVVFAGTPDNRAYGEELKRLAAELQVADRIDWRGFVSNEELIALYAHARAVVFTPIDEDLGYIALEAMLAGKALLTLSDAGEPAALITHGVEGLIVQPNAEALAVGLVQLWDDPHRTRSLGEAGQQRYAAMNISWENAVAKLLAPRDVPKDEPVAAAIPRVRTQAKSPGYQIPTIEALAQLYDLPGLQSDHAYYATHWRRYEATLDLLRQQGQRPRRILEIGSSPPFVFSALLQEIFPGVPLTIIQEGPQGIALQTKIEAKSDAGRDSVELTVVGLNVEKSSLPFPDGYFDLVIAAEVLEHLAIDPHFVFDEVRRTLADGGLFLVTTPNMISLKNLESAAAGGTPYSFGLFVPWNGVYGRHNREYTPREVEALGEFCGFETCCLETLNVYEYFKPNANLQKFLISQGYPIDKREENIFYIGRKNERVDRSRNYPPSLFAVDPSIFRGLLELEEDPPGFVLRIRNHSRHLWATNGQGRLAVRVDRRHQSGSLDLGYDMIALPRDLLPGQTAEISLLVEIAQGQPNYFFEFSLHLFGAGPFTGTGRVAPVTIFAHNFEVSGSL